MAPQSLWRRDKVLLPEQINHATTGGKGHV